MASKSSAPRACSRADTRAALTALRQALLRGCALTTFAFALPRCTPDLSSLSSGVGPAAGAIAITAGASSGGVSAGGTANTTGGDAQAGKGSGAAAGAAQASGGTSGGSGESAGGAGPVAGGAAGEAGSGAAGSCAFIPPNALAHDSFDQGLTGEGFAPVMAVAAQSTSNVTPSVAWDSTVGRTCPGAFRLTGTFKAFASTATLAIGDIRFPAASWAGAVALHAWIKVDPASAPLQGIQLYVVSGANAGGFLGAFDSSQFAFGTWYEMVLPLAAGSDFDPTSVLRVGLQIVLKTAGAAGIPATPPPVSAWLDDIWVEK